MFLYSSVRLVKRTLLCSRPTVGSQCAHDVRAVGGALLSGAGASVVRPRWLSANNWNFPKVFEGIFFFGTYRKSSFRYYGLVMLQTSGEDAANQTVICSIQTRWSRTFVLQGYWLWWGARASQKRGGLSALESRSDAKVPWRWQQHVPKTRENKCVCSAFVVLAHFFLFPPPSLMS